MNAFVAFTFFQIIYILKIKLSFFKVVNLPRWEANDVNPVSVKFWLLNRLRYRYRNNYNKKYCGRSKGKESYEDS